jgi:F0F1-type ATP synthase delta subunit
MSTDISGEQIARQIIDYLAEEGWSDRLPEIVRILEKEAYRNQEITVISAVPLSEEELTEVRRMLTDKWGEHPLVTLVDPALLSGMLIRFGHTVIDLTGKQHLRSLAAHLRPTP